MKIDKNNLIVGLLIGIVIGGGAIGILDANRPKPIFSKASSICDDYLAAFSFADDMVREIGERERRTGVSEKESWQYWWNYRTSMGEAWNNCVNTPVTQ